MFWFRISEREKEITGLRNELDSLKDAVEHQRKKNNDLREKNWEAMEALASTEKMLQDKVNKTSKVVMLTPRNNPLNRENLQLVLKSD